MDYRTNKQTNDQIDEVIFDENVNNIFNMWLFTCCVTSFSLSTVIYDCEKQLSRYELPKCVYKNENKNFGLILLSGLVYSEEEDVSTVKVLQWNKRENTFTDNDGITRNIGFMDQNQKLINVNGENIDNRDFYAIYTVGIDLENNKWVFIFIDIDLGIFITADNNIFSFDRVCIATRNCRSNKKLELHEIKEIIPTLMGYHNYNLSGYEKDFIPTIMSMRYELQKEIDMLNNKKNEEMVNITHNDKNLIEFKIGNDSVYIFPIKIIHLIDNSPLKTTKLKSKNVFDFNELTCYQSFKKLIIYIYKNYIPTPLEMMNDGIMEDIRELDSIFDYINVHGFTKYISTICKYIK